MSTFTTSRNTRGQHVSPKYQSAPYRPSPGRREFIHGRIQPLEDPAYGGKIGIAIMFLVAVFIGFALAVQL